MLPGFFPGCEALATLEGMPDLSVTTSIDSLFLNCKALVESPAIVAPEATSATEVFALCGALKSIDSISLPKVKNLSGFYRGTPLTSYPMFDTSQVEQVTSMFSEVRGHLLPRSHCMTSLPLFGQTKYSCIRELLRYLCLLCLTCVALATLSCIVPSLLFLPGIYLPLFTHRT